MVVSIINLRNALPHPSSPLPDSLNDWDESGILFEVAAHRDCPFHREFNRFRHCCSYHQVTLCGR